MNDFSTQYALEYLSFTFLATEQGKWQSEKPEKLGEALADQHLQLVRQATEKWQVQKKARPEIVPPKPKK